ADSGKAASQHQEDAPHEMVQMHAVAGFDTARPPGEGPGHPSAGADQEEGDQQRDETDEGMLAMVVGDHQVVDMAYREQARENAHRRSEYRLHSRWIGDFTMWNPVLGTRRRRRGFAGTSPLSIKTPKSSANPHIIRCGGIEAQARRRLPPRFGGAWSRQRSLERHLSMTVGRQVARALTAACLTLGLLLGAVQAPAMAAPPSLTITQPSANGSTRDATTVFAGTTSDTVDSVTLAIYAGTDTQVPPVQTSLAIVPVGESWETSAASSLSDGQYTAVVEQTNGAETGSSSVAFTVDTTKPVVSLDLVTSPTIESSPTLTGSAGELPGDSSNVAVTIYDGGSVGGTVARSATVEVSGSRWQYKPEALVDGTYTAQAVQQDAAGNVGESVLPVTFTVDTPAPVVSLNSLPAWTKSSTPTLTGGAGSLAGDRATVHVTVYDGSSVGGAVAESSTVAVSASKWSDTVATLTDGTYTAQVSQEDEAGNVGTSTAVTFTVDTVAPVVSINAVTPPTRNSTPTFTGVAGVLAGDKASVVVTIHEGSSVAGTVVETKAVSPSGSSWSDTPPGLVDGTYTAQVTQEDQAGNVGKSAPVTFTVDTKAPVVSIVAPASRIKESTPTLTGKLGTLSGDDPSVLITIHEGGSVSDPVLGSPSAALVNGSSWTYTAPTLADGTYTVQASQEDEAGNLGKSVAVTFTVDTVAPVVSIEPLASPTKDSTPTLTGAAGVLAGDIASVTVTIYAVESSGDVLLESKAINVSGSTWSYTTPSLGDRTYKVDVSQEDEAA